MNLELNRQINRLRLGLALAILAGLLAGCGSNQATPPPTTAASPGISASPAGTTSAAASPVANSPFFLRPYANATRLDLGKDYDASLKSRAAALLGNQLAGQVSVQNYLTADASNQVMAYYELALYQLGYQKTGRVDISLLTVGTASTLAVLFSKGQEPDSPAVLITTIGPLSVSDIGQLNSYNAATAGNIREKSLLLNVFSGFSLGQVPGQLIIPDTNLVSTRPNVPLHPKANPLDLGAGFFTTINQALAGLVGTAASAPAKLNFYRLPGLPQDLWTFYDSEMPKLNYQRAGQVDVSSVAAIGKVDSKAVLYATGQGAQQTGTLIIALGPWSQADYDTLTKIVLLAKQNFKAGDTILIIVSNLPLASLLPGLIKGK